MRTCNELLGDNKARRDNKRQLKKLMSRRVDEVRSVHLTVPAAPIHTELLYLHCDVPYDMHKQITDLREANQEHSGKKNSMCAAAAHPVFLY